MMKNNQRNNPHSEGFGEPLVRGFFFVNSVAQIGRAAAARIRHYIMGSNPIRVFSFGIFSCRLILGSVSFLIAFPCSGVVPYLLLKTDSKTRDFFRASFISWLVLVILQGRQRTATA